MAKFQIQQTELFAEPDPRRGENGFSVRSVPRPYTVDWLSHVPVRDMVCDLIGQAKHPLVYMDRCVRTLHLRDLPALDGVPTLEVDASEKLKTLDGALELIAFLDANKATKATTLIVLGGGVVQDVAGFACCIYKRGIPWTYAPTTFLAQGDSGMGGKAGLNYKGAKNILALFSAPRRVVIHTSFLSTLEEEDVLSGLGEVFRLHVTGGPEFLPIYEAGFRRYAAGDRDVLNDLLVSALAVKRAVIEEDEFEIDIRRAMNYGHSLGHAFEAITDNAIPHGTAVVAGMLVENEISVRKGLLSEPERDRLREAAHPLLASRIRVLLKGLDLSGILEVLGKDKKSEGKVLKLAVVERLGLIRFIDLPLEAETERMIKSALDDVSSSL